MKYISGLEADRNRRLIRDMQAAKRHKQMSELHEYKEKLRKGQETAQKINELRRIEGYLARLQPHSRIREIQRRPDMEAAKAKLLASIGLSSTPM